MKKQMKIPEAANHTCIATALTNVLFFSFMRKVNTQRGIQQKENIIYEKKMSTRKNKNSTRRVTREANPKKTGHFYTKKSFIR